MTNGRKKHRKVAKQSKNLSLAPGIITLGEQLAVADKREFSSEVEWLIEQEHARRNQTATA